MKFSQKYTIVKLLDSLPSGTEWGVDDWPLHVTLADIFAVDGNSSDIIQALDSIKTNSLVKTKVAGENLFGPEKNIRVKLLENTPELQALHEQILEALKPLNVRFNSPEYTGEGFLPHSTVQKTGELKIDDEITFNSLTLIDMFPDQNGYKRRVLTTLSLST